MAVQHHPMIRRSDFQMEDLAVFRRQLRECLIHVSVVREQETVPDERQRSRAWRPSGPVSAQEVHRSEEDDKVGHQRRNIETTDQGSEKGVHSGSAVKRRRAYPLTQSLVPVTATAVILWNLRSTYIHTAVTDPGRPL